LDRCRFTFGQQSSSGSSHLAATVPTLEIHFFINNFNILNTISPRSELPHHQSETNQEGICRQAMRANGNRLPPRVQFSGNGTFTNKIALE